MRELELPRVCEGVRKISQKSVIKRQGGGTRRREPVGSEPALNSSIGDRRVSEQTCLQAPCLKQMARMSGYLDTFKNVAKVSLMEDFEI